MNNSRNVLHTVEISSVANESSLNVLDPDFSPNRDYRRRLNKTLDCSNRLKIVERYDVWSLIGPPLYTI